MLDNYKGTLSVKDQNIFLKLKAFDPAHSKLINDEDGFIKFGKIKSKDESMKNEQSEFNSKDDTKQEISSKCDVKQSEKDAKNAKIKKENRPIYRFLKQFKQSLIKSSIFSFPLDIEFDKVFEHDEECLDPRFLLLSIYRLINLRMVTLEELVDTNCLAIMFVSLSFKDDQLRRLGYATIVKFRQLLCSDTYGAIWRIILDKLASSLKEDNQLIEPLIVSFFVHLIPFIKTPTYSINDKLLEFFCEKPEFKTYRIVRFIDSDMLRTDDQESSSLYQEVALLILKNGLKTERDFTLCLNCKIIDFLMVNFNSPILFRQKLKNKVLDIFYLISKLPLASKLLCKEKAFPTWLNQLSIEENNLELLNKINKIASELIIHCNHYPLNQIELKLIKNVCTQKIDFLLEQEMSV